MLFGERGFGGGELGREGGILFGVDCCKGWGGAGRGEGGGGGVNADETCGEGRCQRGRFMVIVCRTRRAHTSI